MLIATLIISACGKKMTDTPKDDPTLTTELETEGGSIESGDGYGFTLFDLELITDQDETINIWYDVSKKANATYDNSIEDLHLEEQEAMDQTFIIFDAIRLNKDTPEDQAIEDILKHFEIEDYTKFKLDVDFDENTKLRIDDAK